MNRLLQIPVAVSLTLALPGVALAQVPPPPSGSAPAAPAPAAEPAPAPAAPAAPAPAAMSEEEKLDKAKGLYKEAEALAGAGSWEAAVPKYEEAYYLVPGKHGFAYKVGIAAWNAKDCNKADEYLKHFVKYADPEKYADKVAEAKQILGEIAVSGCATAAPAPAPTATPTTDPDDEENPLAGIKSSEQMREDEASAARDEAEQDKKGLLIGGIILSVVGLGGVGFGVAMNLRANNIAGQLADLSSNNTGTGFPQGDYSSQSDDAPYTLEQNLKTSNILFPIGYGIGGLALAGGIVMIAIHLKRNGSSKNAATPTSPRLTGIGPTLLSGGGGAAATLRF